MDIPYTVKARPDTGLWNAKIAIWLFLASEVMLFGGLFSAYIFLRLASDTPWPTHVLNIKAGFLNTLILIFSSITVLQAWLSLKMRNYRRYQIYMVITIVSAAVFMGIKFSEYGDKFKHYGVRLQDGSILEGHLPPEGYSVKFGEVKAVTLAARRNQTGLGDVRLPVITPGSDGGFLKYITSGADSEVKDPEGNTVKLTGSEISRLLTAAVDKMEQQEAAKKKSDIDAQAAAIRQQYPSMAESEVIEQATKLVSDKFVPQEVFVKLTAVKPIELSINPDRMTSYDDHTATFRDGTVLEGKLLDDTLHMEVDNIDLRRLLPSGGDTSLEAARASIENADAWKVMGNDWKEQFLKHSAEESEKLLGKGSSGKTLNADFQREVFMMEVSLKELHEAKSAEGSPKAEKTTGEGAADVSAGHHDHPEMAIAKKDMAFFSNFTPKYHNYFAIYYALTSLHGLHIIGGAIVLGYFLLFGRKMYETNPEHLTNRVEIGGLFWHFVDVVWMFLFPVLYLM